MKFLKDSRSGYGSLFISDAYSTLVSSSDRIFGAFCLFTLALSFEGWVSGTVPGTGVLLIAAFILTNVASSRISVRLTEVARIRLEVARIFVLNGIFCPVLLLNVGGPLSPWWFGYYIGTIGGAVVMGSLYPTSSTRGVWGVIFWGANLAFAGGLGLPQEERYHLILQVGLLLMVGFVFLEYTAVFRDKASAEHRQFEDTLDRLKAAQAQMVESGKLSALGQMAAGIAHEINSPLAAVQLAAKQVVRESEKTVIDRQALKARAAIIQSIVERITRIIYGMKTFCKQDSETVKTVAVQDVIQDTLVFCEERFRSNGIRFALDMNLGFSDSATMQCRPVQISQVLLNLLNNACDALSPDAEGEIRLKVDGQPERVRMVIEDSGSGIPESVRPRVFEPFFTTKGMGTGTGLGLSISKRIIEEHGGSIWLDPQAARTSFVVELPRIHPDGVSA